MDDFCLSCQAPLLGGEDAIPHMSISGCVVLWNKAVWYTHPVSGRLCNIEVEVVDGQGARNY